MPWTSLILLALPCDEQVTMLAGENGEIWWLSLSFSVRWGLNFPVTVCPFFSWSFWELLLAAPTKEIWRNYIYTPCCSGGWFTHGVTHTLDTEYVNTEQLFTYFSNLIYRWMLLFFLDQPLKISNHWKELRGPSFIEEQRQHGWKCVSTDTPWPTAGKTKQALHFCQVLCLFLCC